MPQIHPLSSDASNIFEDLSGVDSAVFSNPYDALIDACHNDPVRQKSLFSYCVPSAFIQSKKNV